MSRRNYNVKPFTIGLDEIKFLRVGLSVSLGLALVIISGVTLTDWMTMTWLTEASAARGHIHESKTIASPWIASLILVYVVSMVCLRYVYHGVYVLYEVLWGCNVSLIFAILSLYTNRPLLLHTAMAIVSGDQLCWYIDLLGWILLGKFPIGVMKYLTYPENRSMPKTLFASHHLWFLPLCLLCIRGQGPLLPISFLSSMVITGFLSSYCRMTTPFQVLPPKEGKTFYMNINGAYEFWKDVKIDALHCFNGCHPILYLMYLTIVGNLVANGVPFLVLFILSHQIN